MSQQFSARFGKCRVSVLVEGCTKCGTEHSSGWYQAKRVPVTIGGVTGEIPIFICEDCRAENEPLLTEENHG